MAKDAMPHPPGPPGPPLPTPPPYQPPPPDYSKDITTYPVPIRPEHFQSNGGCFGLIAFFVVASTVIGFLTHYFLGIA